MKKVLIGWGFVVVGVVTATTPIWADTSVVGTGLTSGPGVFITMFAFWALIARDPTRDHWAISVTGLVMVMAPWLGAFAGDAAAWPAWIGGAIAMFGAGAAYVADDAQEITRKQELADIIEYEQRHHGLDLSRRG